MENRLKERLTGAAILVALIVLLVPEMFRGQHLDSAAPASSSGEGPPVRSYTIDLNTPAQHTSPPVTPAVSAPPATASAPAAPVPIAQPPIAQPVESEPVVTRSAPAAAPAEEAAPKSAQPKPVAPKNAKSEIAKSEAPRAEPPKSVPVESAAGGWSVQLGLFAKRENAERLVQSAEQKGFSVRVSAPDSKGFYHVHATSLPDRITAQNLAQRLKSAGFSAAVVAP